MNKKIFGIRLGTIITMLICALIALVIWMIVNYKTGVVGADAASFFHSAVQRLK